MEDLGFGLGVLLAICGPLLLLPVTWLTYRLLTRPLLKHISPQAAPNRPAALLIAALLVLVALALSYVPGRQEYAALCSALATPRIDETVNVEGFYRNRLYAYEATRFLDEDGFRYVEGPDPSRPQQVLRYTMTEQGEIETERLDAPTSRYGVRDQLRETANGVLVSTKTVYEVSSGRKLARAANITYLGGPLSILLGSYATLSCPDILTGQGSNDFTTYYRLERVVLREGEGQ